MKLTTLTTLFSLAVACVGLGLAPATRAANFTNFLESLQAEVAARLETNEDAGQRKALTSADKALNPTKDAKTLSQDLTAFGKAVGTLNKGFGEEDEALGTAENTSFNLFIGEADAQIAELQAGAGLHTTVPASLSNALARVDTAYSNAVNNTNWAARVRALNLAFTKIKAARIQLAKSIKAPESLEGATVNVTVRDEGPPLKFSLTPEGTYDTGDGETGTWSYVRTGANTGTFTLNIDGGGSHVLNTTFKSTKSGTFEEEGEGGVTGSVSIK